MVHLVPRIYPTLSKTSCTARHPILTSAIKTLVILGPPLALVSTLVLTLAMVTFMVKTKVLVVVDQTTLQSDLVLPIYTEWYCLLVLFPLVILQHPAVLFDQTVVLLAFHFASRLVVFPRLLLQPLVVDHLPSKHVQVMSPMVQINKERATTKQIENRL